MKTPSSKTRRGNRVFKHHATSRNWTFLRTVDKRRYFFPVGPVLSEAKKIADEIDAYAVLHPMKEVVAKYRPNGSRVSGERRKVPTCGEIIKRYKLLAPRDLGVKKRTAESYISTLRIILQRGLPGKDLNHIHLDELTPSVIRNFRRYCLEGLTNEDKILSRKRSVNAWLASAKSLFSVRAMKLYADWDVSGSEHLLAADYYPRCKKVYRLPPASLIKRTFELLDSYDGKKPDNYAALTLALRFGLRRNEIVHARRDWIEFAGGKARIAVFTERGFSVKGGEDGYAHGPEKAGRKLLKNSEGFDYLIQRRAQEALKPLVKDMRGIGWDSYQKPLHECRKLYGSFLASTENLYVAQRNLRHASPMTTNNFYADLMADEEVSSLWAA